MPDNTSSLFNPAADPVLAADTEPTAPPADVDVVPEDSEGRAGRAGISRLTVFVAAAVLALLGGVYLVDWLVTKGEMAKGTVIGGVDVGGLSPEDALARLESDLSALSAPLPLQAHDEQVSLDPRQAGLTSDLAASVAAVGTRSANPFTRIGALFGATTEWPVVADVDQAALTGELAEIAESTDVAAVEGQVSLAGTAVNVVEPVTGRRLDLAGSVAAISAVWSGGKPLEVSGMTVPVIEDAVRASAAKVAAAAAEAGLVLSGPLNVTAAGSAIAVPTETLAAALTITPDAADGFVVTVDEMSIRSGFQAQVEATQVAPVNATVTIVNEAPVLTPAVDGKSVDWAATDAALSAALRSPDHLLTVVYRITPAAISTETMRELGIKEVVSEFTTGGFAYDSGQNVRQAAAEVQGAIVLPGETFSLNGHTGKRGAEEGYIEAAIIKDGVIDRAIGGGISQFATTLFNAGYFAGLEDIEHKAHSFYISRYPAGREATVFEAPDGTSVIDVKFRNIHPTAILIETIWTPSNITVRMWGTKSVEVESNSGDRYAYTDAPTKTIPYGETCAATNGSSGFSIDVTRVVRDLAGNELSRETESTVYRGQVKVICEPPPPVDPTTPTPPPGG